jgi:hypothetical protein
MLFPDAAATVCGCAGNTALIELRMTPEDDTMHTTDRTTHWQGVCTSNGHRMKKFVVKSTLKDMRRHVTKMGTPRVYCEHCNADTSLRWERAKELV